MKIILFSVITAALAVILVIIMMQFNPDQIGLGRYAATQHWLNDLFSSEFPYAPDLYISGFPFLFVLAMPFYFLGNIGLLQIFSFMVFAAIIYFRHYKSFNEKLRVLFLLIISPIFIYEVVTRSDLFSNMVLVLLYLEILEVVYKNKKPATAILLGLVGGFLLSTRGIVLLIYIIFIGYILLRHRFGYLVFLASIFVGFLLTLLPFMLWDWSGFADYGPFAVQMWYIPRWFLALAVIGAAICALVVKSKGEIYLATSIMLFAVVAVPFLMIVFRVGIHDTVFKNFFDISYFAFAQPFVLLSFAKSNRRKSGGNSG